MNVVLVQRLNNIGLSKYFVADSEEVARQLCAGYQGSKYTTVRIVTADNIEEMITNEIRSEALAKLTKEQIKALGIQLKPGEYGHT